MVNVPHDMCVRGLHSLKDPRNVGRRPNGQRHCMPCKSAAKRAVALPEFITPPTQAQLRALQARADGLTDDEAAALESVTPDAVRQLVLRARRTLAVTPSAAAAVAVCLAYGLITPDTSGPLPPKDTRTAPYALSVIALVQGRRAPYMPKDVQRARLLDAVYAWTEPHAVSVLWAAGLIIPRDVAVLFAKEK